MTASSISRLGTANTYDNTLRNLTTRQSALSSLQEQLSSGKKINRPSDDPAGAAQAERATTRIERVATEQRALAAQRNTVAMTESTLGDATAALQSFRDLVVQAGNASLGGTERLNIAKELTGLRDQLIGYANRTDTNGLPLFSGLASAIAPFIDSAGGVTFSGVAGERASTDVSIPFTADGQAAWMSVPTGNGVFTTTLGSANTGTLFSDVGTVTDPTAAAAAGYDHTISFSVTASSPPVTTYTVTNNTTSAVSAALPYVAGQPVTFDGMTLTVRGTPVNGDRLDVKPSATSGPGTGMFGVLDSAIAGMYAPGSTTKGASSLSAALNQSVARALAEIDTGMDRLSSARAKAGALLNRADAISSIQDTRDIQLQADKSRAEDIDMVKGIADFQNQQTGYQAALQTYAQVQKLSLFNYING
jgi:flagellar hook-associated protein 3 FlgL